MKTHVSNCDCLDCVKHDMFESHFSKHHYMYEDFAEGTADKFIGGELVAIQPMNVYSRPDGTLLRTLKKGAVVGKIQSYVQKNGIVWWQLFPGNEFVKHGTGLFDTVILEKSLAAQEAKKQTEIQKKVDERLAANTNPLYRAGKDIASLVPSFDNLKYILYMLAVVIVVIIAIQVKKAFS